jgi:hypothetical protein
MSNNNTVWLVTYLEGNQIVSQTHTKRDAFRIARAKARELYNMYKSVGAGKPIEITNKDGSISFVLRGMVPNIWPRVEEVSV